MSLSTFNAATEEQELSVFDALNIFPEGEKPEHGPIGFRKLPKKSHIDNFKELVSSGANSPMFAVKKDKRLLGSFEKGPSTQKDDEFVAPSEEEMRAIVQKLHDTDIQCWRTKSTESVEADDGFSAEINDLITSF